MFLLVSLLHNNRMTDKHNMPNSKGKEKKKKYMYLPGASFNITAFFPTT